MGLEIVKKGSKDKANTNVIRITLLNIFETCIHRDALEIAEYYRNEIPLMLKNETLLYEHNIYHFLDGLLQYKKGEKESG